MSNGSTDGYFGPLSAKETTRLSVAIPIFSVNKIFGNDTKRAYKRQFDIIPTPYYYTNISDKTTQVLGIGLSLMASRFYGATESKLGKAFSINYNYWSSRDNQSK